MAGQPSLRSERLVLRPFVAADGPDVERLAGAREVADTTLTIPHPYPAGAGAEWIATHPAAWDQGSAVTFAITDRSTGELYGAIGLTIVREHEHAEIGYWVGVPHWNRGYCTEAASAVLDFAFGDLGLHRVHGHYFTRNLASARVMQKLGMTYEGVQRNAFKRWGRFEDVGSYAILGEEWTNTG